MFEFRNQPLKALYRLYAILDLLLVRLPLWTVLFLIPALRPRKSWTFKQAFMVNLIRNHIKVIERVYRVEGSPTHHSLDTSDSALGMWVEPFPSLVVNEVEKWAQNARVKPIRIPGYWVHKLGLTTKMGQKPVSPDEKVVYFLHGGGYIELSAHPTKSPTSSIPRGLLKYCKEVGRSFAIEYRLSSGKPLPDENPFPAALIDAVMGYNYLVNVVGFAPSQIIVAGDSAGGNLALALGRYLVENANALPTLAPPAGLLLLSPWAFLGRVEFGPGNSVTDNASSDYLLPPREGELGYPNLAFLGPLHSSEASTNPYISPASPALNGIFTKNFPRSLVVSGDAELLLDQIRVLQKRMKEEVGEDRVQYCEAKDATHDFVVFPWHEPQRSETLQIIAKWVAGLAEATN